MLNDNIDDPRTLLERFVVDNSELEQLEGMLSPFNVFEAIGATRQELRHSDFLSFLLDPTENHGLKDYFLKTLFKKVLLRSVGPEIGAIDIDVADLSAAEVERERFQIDVLVHSERAKMVFAIENKIDSGEHDNQLERYGQSVETAFPGYRRVLIYLTPDGEEPSDPNHWIAMSYGTLMEAVQSVLAGQKRSLAPPVVIALEHYAALIGRHIVTDSEIAKLCQQIYRKHKDALELIFEHRPDMQLEMKTVLENEVAEHPGYTLDHCTKGYVRFRPTVWDNDPRQKAGEGWTPTRRAVLFEILNGPDFLRLKLVIGPTEAGNSAAAELRAAVFEASQRFRADFPGNVGALYPRFTTVMSRELVKKKDYGEQNESVPDKAREALRHAFEHEIPRIVERLQEVFIA